VFLFYTVSEMDMGWVNPWVGLGLGPNFLFRNGLGWFGSS